MASRPIKGSAAASNGRVSATVPDSSATYSRVTAPIATWPSALDTPDSSSMPLMSMSTAGRASRSASSGIKLWPPASTLASSWYSASRSTASATVVGASYSTGGSFIGAALRSGGSYSLARPGSLVTLTTTATAMAARLDLRSRNVDTSSDELRGTSISADGQELLGLTVVVTVATEVDVTTAPQLDAALLTACSTCPTVVV